MLVLQAIRPSVRFLLSADKRALVKCQKLLYIGPRNMHMRALFSANKTRLQTVKATARQKSLRAMMSQGRTALSVTSDEQASTSGSDLREGGGATALPARRGKIQNCDFSTLAACAAEMMETWVPSKVDQIIQPDTSTICFLLRNQAAVEGGRGRWLYLSWHQTHARLSMGPKPERGAASEAYSLAGQMQAALRGLVLLEVSLPVPWERLVEMQLGPRLDESSHHLFLEVMGKYSNLVLTDEKRRIVACARQISGKMSSLRSLQTGTVYAPPPPQGGADPSNDEPLEDWVSCLRASGTYQIAGAMCRSYRGMSPAMADGICRKAGVDGASELDALKPEDLQSAHNGWLAWIEAVVSRTFNPTAASPPDGSVSVIGAHPSGVHGGALELCDVYFRMPEEEDAFGKLLHRISSGVTKAVKRLESKQVALRKQLDQVAESDSYQKQADLIVANLYKYSRGDASISVEDWDTSKTTEIALDPSQSAQEQTEALYKKARKLRRTSDNVEPLLHQAALDLEHLQEVESQLEGLQPNDHSDLLALKEIEEELVQQKFVKPAPDAALAAKGAAKARKAKRKSASTGPDFREFQSPGGFQVLVGRNNLQNDELTHKVANGTDLWFHARGRPGSHTVLRIPSGRKESSEDLQFAANAAAYFSKAKAEGKAEVVYALIKDLNKPKGARPGQV